MSEQRSSGYEATSHECVKAAARLVPVLRERARSTEQLRRVPEETIEDLKEAGLFRLLQPARYGGLEVDMATYADTVWTLSAADGSVGWVHAVVAVHAWSAALYSAQAAEEIWGRDQDVLLTTASLCKEGGIEKVEDGYRVRGLFGFASGSHHTSWAMVMGVPHNAPEMGPVWCLIPDSDYQIVDNWHVMGLCATGSCDLRIDAHVPAYRVIEQVPAAMGKPTGSEVSGDPMYRLPFLAIFGLGPTLPVIGAAQGALDDYIVTQRERVSLLGVKVAMDPDIQAVVAESAAELDAARLSMLRDLAELTEVATKGERYPRELILRTDRDRVLAIRHAVRAVDRVFANAGGRALSLDNPLQRAWRDVHAGAAHGGNQLSPWLAAYGAHAFGIGE